MLPWPAEAQDEEEDDEEVEGHGKHSQLKTVIFVQVPRYPVILLTAGSLLQMAHDTCSTTPKLEHS